MIISLDSYRDGDRNGDSDSDSDGRYRRIQGFYLCSRDSVEFCGDTFVYLINYRTPSYISYVSGAYMVETVTLYHQ